MGDFECPKFLEKKSWTDLKANKSKSKQLNEFLNQVFSMWKKIRMELLLSLAEIEIIQSNHGVFENFTINQSESSITYKKVLNFLFFSINQSEMRFKESWIFSKFTVNKSTFSKSTNQHFLRVNYLSLWNFGSKYNSVENYFLHVCWSEAKKPCINIEISGESHQSRSFFKAISQLAWYTKILRLSLNHLGNTVRILDNCWKNQEKTCILSKKSSDVFAHLWKLQNYFNILKKKFEFFKASCKNSWPFLAHVLKPIF